MSDDTKKSGVEAPEIIPAKSDDRLTRLLGSIEKVEERLGEVDELRKANEDLRESWEHQKARVERLEDKGSNTSGTREYESPFLNGASEQDRRREVAKWLVDTYGMNFIAGYEPVSYSMTRAGQTGDGSAGADGGFAAPAETAAEIARIVESHGVARQVCRNMPMSSDTLSIPTRAEGSGSVSVAWTSSENTDASVTADKLSDTALTAKTLIGLGQVSNELDSDSAVDFASYLVDVFGEALAAEEDNQVFGESSSEFVNVNEVAGMGQRQMGGATSGAKVAFTDITLVDIVELLGEVDPHSQGNAIFVAHPNFYGALRQLSGEDNPHWAPLAAGDPGTILGRKYYSCVKCPSTETVASKTLAYCGDFSHAILGIRQNPTVAWSAEAGFKSNSRFVRLTERIAFAVAKPAALAKLITTDS